MLSTLMRYDFKRLFKWFLPACGLMLLSAAMFTFLQWRFANLTRIENFLAIPYGLLTFVSVIGLMAGYIAVFAVICHHFYKNLMTDEGYLTFTLPVTQNQILASKVIAGSVCALVGTVVMIAAILIIAIGTAAITASGEISDEIGIIGGADVPTAGAVLSVLITGLIEGVLELISFVIRVYFAIVLGCSVAKTHKVAASFGFYYLTNLIVGFISGFGGVVFGILLLGSETVDQVLNATSTLMLLTAAFNIVTCVVLYLWSLKLLKTKLNLQ